MHFETKNSKRNLFVNEFKLINVLSRNQDNEEFFDIIDFVSVSNFQKTRKKAIQKYMSKKYQRIKGNNIKYKIRQKLASKRKRKNGKFIKDQRINLKQIVEQFFNS